MANSRAINNGSVEWLINELRNMDRDMPGGIVTNFHSETFLQIKKDAIGEHRSGEKRFYIELSFDAFNN